MARCHFGAILVVWWLRLTWWYFGEILSNFGVILVGLVALAGLSCLVSFWCHFGVVLAGLVAPAGLVLHWCHFCGSGVSSWLGIILVLTWAVWRAKVV